MSCSFKVPKLRDDPRRALTIDGNAGSGGSWFLHADAFARHSMLQRFSADTLQLGDEGEAPAGRSTDH